MTLRKGSRAGPKATRRRDPRYGWVPDLPDHRDFTYAAPPRAAARGAQTTVDLRDKCPEVYNQRFTILSSMVLSGFAAMLLAGISGSASAQVAAERRQAAGGNAGSPPADSSPVTTSSRMSSSQRATFFHLSEGSEVYPLSFLVALRNSRTGKLFLEDVDRFGLISDEKSDQNPYGLPIGVTADRTVDLDFQMIGINCAACHVGQFTYGGKTLVVVGAPNQFDITAFFKELADSTIKTFESFDETLSFFGRLFDAYHGSPDAEREQESPAVLPRGFAGLLAPRAHSAEALMVAPFGTMNDDRAQNVLSAYQSAAALKEAGEFESNLVDVLRQTYDRAIKLPPDDLGAQLGRKALPEAWGDYLVAMHAAAPEQMLAAADRLTEATAGKSFVQLDRQLVASSARAPVAQRNPLSRIEKPEMRSTWLIGTAQSFYRTVRVLQARATFLVGLLNAHRVNGTEPGPGRVDAFGGARNLVFPNDSRDTTAPVCWPHLWGIGRITWYHWDGSTNSLLERNVGQALGLGAVFDRTTFLSTVKLDNIAILESLATKIATPVWPAKLFGAVEDGAARRGAKVFEQRCAKCHYPLERISDLTTATRAEATRQDPLFALSDVGTDPRRALDFAAPVGNQPFNDAIADVLHNIIKKAGGTLNPGDKWRITRQYSSRPLDGIWASPPYLHNGSVPTIYDLLLPVADRPKTFPLGHRQYDPKRLGYTTDVASPRFEFNTDQTGNSKSGHSGPAYGTDMPEGDRGDLLEYIKSNLGKAAPTDHENT